MTSDRPLTVDIAGVGVDLVGDHPTVGLIHRELGTEAPVDTAGTVTFRAGAPVAAPADRSIGQTTWSDDQVRIGLPRSGFTVEFPITPDPTAFTATVWVEDRPMPFDLPASMFRWAEPTNLDPLQAQAYTMIHTVLESLVFFNRCAVPLHASVLSSDGAAVALTSAGGVGKTSTSLALLGSDTPWTLLSDDMTMLTPGRTIHAYRRWPMIYDYNLRDNPSIASTVRRRGGMSGRAQWALTKPIHRSKRRRRLPATELGSTRIEGASAPLRMVAFLFRHAGSSITVSPLTALELARRSTAIIELEYTHLLDGLRLAEALGAPELVDPLLQHARTDYEEIFGSVADLVDVGIPATGSSAGDVAELVRTHLGVGPS